MATSERVSQNIGSPPARKKVIGIVMAYNCADMIGQAFRKIPKDCFDDIICVDDGSTDHTVEVAKQLGIPVFTHPHTGYGGNLFFGFREALSRGGTHMIELHGDGQYDFAVVPTALERMAAGCDMVIGNRYERMLQPLQHGMDWIRYLGNILLSTIGRLGLGISSRDLFAGFRAYSRKLVETIDMERMSDTYFFAFELLSQVRYCDLKICQIPVGCDYKGEHTSMKLSQGVPAILHTCYTVVLYRLARLNIKLGVFAALPASVKK